MDVQTLQDTYFAEFRQKYESNHKFRMDEKKRIRQANGVRGNDPAMWAPYADYVIKSLCTHGEEVIMETLRIIGSQLMTSRALNATSLANLAYLITKAPDCEEKTTTLKLFQCFPNILLIEKYDSKGLVATRERVDSRSHRGRHCRS